MKKLLKFFQNNTGFSIIEILVAVSIFAVLCIIALLNFSVVSQKTRDARRVEDLLGIRSALELYRLEADEYPDSLGCDEPLNYNDIIFMENIPCDPETGLPYGYYRVDELHYIIGAQTELAQTSNQECDDLNEYLGLLSPSPSPVDCIAEGQSCSGPDCSPCCEDLTSIGMCVPFSYDPLSCDCTGAHYCTNCGNGICETGENVCNCSADCPSPSPSPSPSPICIEEGGSRMAILEALPCCSGLTQISCMVPDADGICPPGCMGATICAKCPDGVCGSGENYCNCPADCFSPSPSPTQEQLDCESSSGTWRLFSDACADSCGVHEICAQVETMSCDCTTFDASYCWNGTSCQEP